MKNLPIGIQALSEIRARNCVYVDKTRLVSFTLTDVYTFEFKFNSSTTAAI